MRPIRSIRIRDFLYIPMTWGWDFSTINPTNSREGVRGFLGLGLHI